MSRYGLRQVVGGTDDQRLYVIRQDFSGGQNTRLHASKIGDNQAEELTNCDIGIGGQLSKCLGSVLIGNDLGSTSPAALHNFEIQGSTPQLLMAHSTYLHKWEGSGNWTELKNDFTASTDVGIVSTKESGISPDDVVIVQNGIDNAFRLDSAGNWQDLGDTNTSPPKTTVMGAYGNRLWGLKDDLLYFSDAYPADFSAAFDRTTNAYRVPVGDERGIGVTRDLGLVLFGKDAIWALAPSVTPAATDKPEPLVTSLGVVSKKGWCSVGDDFYFFAKDGLRTLKRTVQDKLQVGADYPLSYGLKTNYEEISWANIEKLSMIHFDNKLFISVPTGANTFKVWVYFIPTQSWVIIDGINPTCFETYRVSSEERMYYGKVNDTVVYRGWYGHTFEGTTTTNGTAITETFIGREENFGQPLIWKNGCEVEIEAAVAGAYDLDVYASIDGGDFQTLGQVELLDTTSPTLPVALPFTLSEGFIVRKKFHLDSIGRFRTIQIKIVNADANTDPIIVYSINITAFAEEYNTE